MANIAQLADAAVRVKNSSDASVGWLAAAQKAVRGSGITHTPDVKRLAGKIVSELGRRGAFKRRSRRAVSGSES